MGKIIATYAIRVTVREPDRGEDDEAPVKYVAETIDNVESLVRRAFESHYAELAESGAPVVSSVKAERVDD